MFRCVEGVCECLAHQEERLNELDRVCGDRDCGSTFKAGTVGRQPAEWDS